MKTMPVIRRRENHTVKNFFKRTISAQLHLFGSVLAIIGSLILLNMASQQESSLHFWACLAFSLTSIMVFLTSSIYHFLNDGYHISLKLEQVLEDIDHFAIYLFIAGSYTPFLINVLNPPWSWILLIVIWTTGIGGIIYTHFKPRLPHWAQHRFFSTSIFLMMGWALLVRIGDVIELASSRALFLLVAGGISYSIGAVIYATKRPRLFEGIFGFHELWHIMVMIGFAFHYGMVIQFYIP